MDEGKQQDFSRTTMWKKSIAAEKQRQNSWMGKTTLVLLTLGGVMALLAFGYLVSR